MPEVAVSSAKVGMRGPLSPASADSGPAIPARASVRLNRIERIGLFSRLQRVGVGADAAPLRESALDRCAKMDAPVEPRDPRLLGRCPEIREATRLQAIAFTRPVLEGEILTEQVRQHHRGRA